MAEGGLRAPGNFFKTLSLTNPSESSRSWSSWLDQFDFYMVATEKNKKSQEIQVATLLNQLGHEGQELFKTFILTDEDRKKLGEVKKKFTEYFSPRVREEFERYRFYKRVQRKDERFDSFLASLQTLIATCNFHADEKDKALRDRIVIGITSEAVREELLNVEADLDLAKCINVCQRAEATKSYLYQMAEPNSSHVGSAVDAVSKPKYSPDNTRNNNRSRNMDVKNCKYCGRDHPRRNCPAYGKICSLCGNKNHFAKVCKIQGSTNTAGKTKPVSAIIAENSVSDDIAFTVKPKRHASEWFITVKCDKKPLKLKVDTGASCNVIPKSIFNALSKENQLRKDMSGAELTSYSGHTLPVLGVTSLLLERDHDFSVHDFKVTDAGDRCLLGFPSACSMGLVKPIDAISNSVASQFSNVFEGLGKLDCKHALRLKDDAKPVIQSPRRVPFRIRDKLRSTLDSMEASHTIVKVKIPTDWVHPIVNILKPDGSLRVCLDPTELNKCIKREHYALPTASEIFSRISGSRVFSTLDATSGFLQLELDEASSYLTTFATPFGRYRFLRLPYGISSAPEVFHRTVNELFCDIEGVETYVDDILIHAPTNAEHDKILKAVLARCEKINLRLNLSKCKFEKAELKYLGHIIGNGQIKADPAKIQAIIEMPEPSCSEEVKRIIGMATYLAKFCPNLSEITAPLRNLTTKGAEWVWGKQQKNSLDQLKQLLSASPVLKAFDPSKPVTLNVDSSKSGMGAVIMQDDQPIEYASCALSHAQQAYAQIEKEFLAIQYGLNRFHQYVYGQQVHVETDHLPLLGIMRKGLNELTPRLLRMRLRTQYYDFRLTFKPGSKMFISDTLSRAYLDEICEFHDDFVTRDYNQVHAVVTGILSKPSFKQKFKNAVSDDASMKVLKSYILGGWPNSKHGCIEPLKAFWNVKDELSAHEDFILRNNQLVVPLAMRRAVLDDVHKGHLGISKCHERAKNAVYWPGYHGQISDMVESCSACQENMRANAKTILEPYEIPEYPMQTVSMDVFHLEGKEFLVTVDRFSKWPSCYELKQCSSKEIIDILARQFLDFGRPENIICDNATYFTSYEFQCFAESSDIKLVTVSPYTSRSNGLAERMNQTVKSCLTKAKQTNQNLYDVIRAIRSAPIGDGLPSPAVLLQGRALRDNLNFTPNQLKHQNLDLDNIDRRFRQRQARGNNDNKASKPREFEFIEGMDVWIKSGHRKWLKAKIIGHADTPRSFMIELDDGRVFRRNQSILG